MNPDAPDERVALDERLARMKRETATDREREQNNVGRRLRTTAMAGRQVDDALRRALADLIEVAPDF